MATAITIINDALKEICVLSEGETASADMADDALRALNRIMEVLSNESSFAYTSPETTFNLTGQASFTIGPTGDSVGLRPIKIDSATVLLNNVTYPVEVIDVNQWDSIQNKTTTGTKAEFIYYEGNMTNGIVYVYPKSTCTLKFRQTDLVNTFATISTALSMPPGYEEYLIKALAINISPQYTSAKLSPVTVKAAKDAFNALRGTNILSPIMSVEHLTLGRKSNIYNG